MFLRVRLSPPCSSWSSSPLAQPGAKCWSYDWASVAPMLPRNPFDQEHPMTRMTPCEAFVETLAAHGVKHIFGIVGSAYMDALDIFEPAGIRFISVAHEQNAGHMADGYSRVSGRQGVCIAQNGPGITNFVTAIAAAYWAHSPVVMHHAGDRRATHGPGRLPGDRAAADLLEDHQVPGPCQPARAHRRADQPLLRLRADRARPGPDQHPARSISTARSTSRSRSRSRSSAAPAGRRAWTRRRSCWPRPSSR